MKLTPEERKAILTGTVLAIDPSSGAWSQKNKEQSHPGWARFHAGVLVASGVVPMDGKKQNIFQRLRMLYDALGTERPDVLVVEQIRGTMAHQFLKWSVGVIIAAVRATHTVEMPIATWRAYAGKGHKKSDENDAIVMGQTLVHHASREST